MTVRIALFLVSLLLCPAVGLAQSERVVGFQPRVFAVVNGTVVVRPGEVIEAGTLVVRDGLIAAVGKDVAVPADADVIDAKGLFVYAGFIDAAAEDWLNDKKPEPAAGRDVDFARHALAATRPDNRHSLTPEWPARENLKQDAKLADAARQLGFTAVHVLSTGRVAGGRGTLVATSGAPLRESLLIGSTMGQFELFAPRGNVYPSTLMGATAHLRQAFLDADRHVLHQTLDRDGAAGVERPPVDPVLDALAEIADGRRRAVFRADSRDDIHRALDFAGEHGFPVTLWGGRDAHLTLERLKEEQVDLVVQVDFGDEPKIEPDKPSEELKSEVKDPLRVQEDRRDQWRRRVGGLKELHEAGVRFALSSRGLKNRGELFKSVRQAIDAGLCPDAALSALTSDAAGILGIDARLGTLEAGKFGHVVVTTGPFQHEKAKVRYVLIDGRKYEYHPDAKPVEEEQEPEARGQKSEVSKKESGDRSQETEGGDKKDMSDSSPASSSETTDNGQRTTDQPTDQPTELKSDRLQRPIQTGGNVLITNATVLTGTGETLTETSILVRDGKIAAIGPDLKSESLKPDDPQTVVIDAAGRFVMPGIIDTHSHIMITGGINEATQSIVPEVRIRDVLDSDDVSEYRALAGGVTAARIFHGSANVIGGQDAVVKLKHGTTAAEHLIADAPQGVKFALGENVKFRSGRFPNTRMGVEATLNRAFLEAIDYRRQWMEHERRKKSPPLHKGGPGGVKDGPNASESPPPAPPYEGGEKLLPPRRDLRLEALADIVNHQKFIHSHCYRADEILMLLRVASNLGIRVWSLQHVLEGYKVAPEIVAHGASCSTFADWWAYKVEAFDATPYNAALLKEAGANVVIKSDDWELIRHLALEAAKTVRYGGMTPDDAIQTVTLNAARELGLDDRIGSIEVGKDADLAIYNGHPLSAYARCEMTLIEGEVYFSREHVPSAMTAAAAETSARAPELVFPPQEIREKQLDLTGSPNGRYALVGATLHLADGPAIANGTVFIDGTKIVAVGSDVQVPSDVKVIDAAGLHVAPGFIDAGTTLGLVEIGKVRETHDFSEGGLFQPDLRAGVALNPDSELIPVARAGGITTALVRPTGGVIAGQASLARLAGWTAPEMLLEVEAGLQIIWPTGDVARKHTEQLGEFLKQARLYDRLRTAAEDDDQAGGPIVDPRYESLRSYLRGDKPVFFEAHSRQAIAEVLLFAEKEQLRPIITGGTDAWKLADELKKRDVPVIVGPVMRRPVEEYDPFDAPYANPGRLHEAGVRFCIRSDNASNSRNAPFEAAMAVAYGLPESEGLRAVTLAAAEVLGLDDRIGSLTPGKLANLVITDGPPLQHTTQVKGVFLEGRPYPPVSRQTRFYDRYRERLHELRRQQSVAQPAGSDQ